jgi:Helix-turn-helix domain
MSNSEEGQPPGAVDRPPPSQIATVVSNHEGEDGMGSRSMTVGRYEEIRRRLAEGRGLREIARALNCSRDTIREVRDGARQSPDAAKPPSDPLWMLQLEWPAIVHDLGLGHPLKLIWADGVAHQGPEQWPWSS